MTIIHPSGIGLTLGTQTDPYSPRKEYLYSTTGLYALAQFLGISPDCLRNQNRSIWLTPATVEDLLIYDAFGQYRFVSIATDPDTRKRTLTAFNSEQHAKQAIQNQLTLLVNPRQLQTH